MMLTINDCIALSHLTEAEIGALSCHEHVPDMAAIELGAYLLHCPDGTTRIRAIIRDDIAAARAKGDLRRVALLKGALADFLRAHAALAEERTP